VIAESFARIFFRNCIATGELYPAECEERLCEKLARPGTSCASILTLCGSPDHADGLSASLAPLGEVRRVVAAGGLFNYARETGLVPERSAAS
jgi:3-isopropylmalate/(R)-2-methylmalate dehydratase small subunit